MVNKVMIGDRMVFVDYIDGLETIVYIIFDRGSSHRDDVRKTLTSFNGVKPHDFAGITSRKQNTDVVFAVMPNNDTLCQNMKNQLSTLPFQCDFHYL